eukprot:357759-Chlamydomonas_euryale.AAC.2
MSARFVESLPVLSASLWTPPALPKPPWMLAGTPWKLPGTTGMPPANTMNTAWNPLLTLLFAPWKLPRTLLGHSRKVPPPLHCRRHSLVTGAGGCVRVAQKVEDCCACEEKVAVHGPWKTEGK